MPAVLIRKVGCYRTEYALRECLDAKECKGQKVEKSA
jgi:hypothetical protein